MTHIIKPRFNGDKEHEKRLHILCPTIIKLYVVSRLSLRKIASKLGYSFYYIRKILLENRIKMRDKTFGTPWRRKYKINNYVFKNIDSAEKSYWLGFIYADGNIHRNRFRIVLNNKDYCHLEKLRRFLGYTRAIKTYGNYSDLSIYDNKFIEDLKNNGVTERKSLTISFPSIKKIYFKPFILGYFDGDGWLYIAKKKLKSHIGICSGSYKFLESIRNVLRQNKFKPNRIYKEKTTTYRIMFGGYRAIKFGNFLYDKNLQLERKLGKLDLLDQAVHERARYAKA